MILTQGSVLAAPLGELQLDQSLQHKVWKGWKVSILFHVLKDSGGRFGGPSGAAARLGVPRTTLQSKLRKLRTNRTEYRAR